MMPDQDNPYVFSVMGYSIQVSFQEHAVHIINDSALWRLIGNDPQGATALLSNEIYRHFEQRYGRPFAVHPDSLIVEIWGHIYCEYFALVLEKIVALKFVELAADKVISYCEVIDCGEQGFDHNRSFWDVLAPFRDIIAGWLPDDIHTQNLKEDI